MAVLEEALGQALHDVVPPLGVGFRVFVGDVVLGHRGRHLGEGRHAEHAVEHAVGRHHDAVEVGILRDPLQLRDAAHVRRVRAHDVDCVGLDELAEVLAQVDLLAGVDVGGGVLGDIPIDLGQAIGGVVAGDHVLEPHDVEGLHALGKLQRVDGGEARAAVKGDAHLVAHDLLDRAHVVDEVMQALVRQQAAVGAVRVGHGRGDRVGGVGVALLLRQAAEARAVEGNGGLDDGKARLLVQPQYVLRPLTGVLWVGVGQLLLRYCVQ